MTRPVLTKQTFRRLIAIISASCFSISAFASDTTAVLSFRYPLGLPMSLSGNYGELRSNHFHSGIDFRVGGVVGAPVYATESGYISKISISPWGYGNALYITHDNGYLSVYGHLQKYADKIWRYASEQQYKNEKFELSSDLSPDLFPVRKGDLIGYAGNTGSSGGPHLHFEIRQTNIPLNVFERGFISIKDNTAPQIRNVIFIGLYDKGGTSLSVDLTGKNRAEKNANLKDPVILLPEKSYVAIDAIDRMEGTSAKLAVEVYNVYLDGKLIFSLDIGEVPFEKGRYINSLLYYPMKKNRGSTMIKSYVEEGNALKDKIIAADGGLIVIKDSLEHSVKLEVMDYKKNKTIKLYKVKRGDIECDEALLKTDNQIYMDWGMSNIYSTDQLELMVPPASLYSSAYITVDSSAVRSTPFSPTWIIGNPEIPMQNGATIAVKCNVPDSLISKAILAEIDSKGKLSFVGGVYDKGFIKSKIDRFGKYTVATDCEKPRIASAIKDGATVKSGNIGFNIYDNLSGIASYNVTVDGEWILSRFDGKTARLSVSLSEAKIKRGRHTVIVTVTDNRNNTAVLKRSVIY